ITQEIDSLTSSLKVLDYLGANISTSDLGAEGVSLWLLQRIFDSDVAVLSGTLTDEHGNASNVSLTVKLPEWIKLTP
ncbi:MAG: hypothetical protein PHD36_06000, partial [Desulfotomaculaceae bacterium]|nr:hypothetical protein [Desulfotomaculaceae bacterium]